MTPQNVPRPIPSLNPDQATFYDYCKNGELRFPKCTECGSFRFPPEVTCPKCTATSHEWLPVSGRGTVFSWVVMTRAYHPAFEPPYAVAIIELEEGPRLYSNVLGVDPHSITQDMPVIVGFEKIDDEHTIPFFHAR